MSPIRAVILVRFTTILVLTGDPIKDSIVTKEACENILRRELEEAGISFEYDLVGTSIVDIKSDI